MTNMDPGRNPPRYQRASTGYTGWIIGAVAALAVIAAIVYGMSDRHQTASTKPPDTTTGQTNRAPAVPQPDIPATIR
jgi:hypothetical protein